MQRLITCAHTAREDSPHNVLHSSSYSDIIRYVHVLAYVGTGPGKLSWCLAKNWLALQLEECKHCEASLREL